MVACRCRRDKERRQRGGAADPPQQPHHSRLAEAAAEWSEAQQAFLLSSPSGLGVGAEAAIARSIAEGALDNLPGKGGWAVLEPPSPPLPLCSGLRG